MVWAIGVVAAGLVVALWASRAGRERIASWGKMVASSGMVLVAALAGPATAYGWLIMAGLAFCWVGDLMLLGRTSQAFVAGMMAFLLGHLAYAAAFWSLGLDALRLGIAVVWVMLLAILVQRWLWPHLGRRMRGPMLAYIAVIGLMVITGAAASHHSNWLLIGATLFFTSDLFVARNRFIGGGWINRLVGLPLYYAAQVILAVSVGVFPEI